MPFVLVAVEDAILDVDGGHTARLQHPVERRDQEVHLLPEQAILRVVPEVFLGFDILVMIAEGDAGQDHVHALIGHGGGFQHRIVVYQREVAAALLGAGDAQAAADVVGQRLGGQAILPDDLAHAANQLIVRLPLALQHRYDLILCVRVDDVHLNDVLLAVALQAVDRLDKVTELVAHAQVDGPVAMRLEVGASANHHGLGAEDPRAALCEIHQAALVFVVILRAKDLDQLRDGLLQRPAFILQVVPDDEVRTRLCSVHDLFGLLNAQRHAVPLLTDGLLDAGGGILEQVRLAIALHDVPRLLVVSGEAVPAHGQGRHGEAFVGMAQVGGRLQEKAPTGNPEPEVTLHVGQQFQVAGLVGVATKPASKGKAGVDVAQEVGEVDQLAVVVGRRRGRCHPAVGDVGQQRLELRLGLCAQVAQDGGFVQADGFDVLGQVLVGDVAIAQALVVGDEEGRLSGFRLGVGAHVLELHVHRRAVDLGELVAGAQRADLDDLAARVAHDDLAQQFDLLAGLVHPELAGQQGAAAAGGPTHGVCSVRREGGRQVGGVDLEAVAAHNVDLVLDDPAVVVVDQVFGHGGLGGHGLAPVGGKCAGDLMHQRLRVVVARGKLAVR